MNKTDEQIKQAVYANLPNEHCTIMQDMVELTRCESAGVWSCTPELRWLNETIVTASIGGLETGEVLRTLQQKWLSSTGEVKWQDVPTVKDERCKKN